MKHWDQFLFYLACQFLLLFIVTSCSDRSRTQTSDIQRQALPREAVMYLIRAQEAFRQHDYAAALAFTDSVARFNPDLTDLHFLRGRIFTETKQLKAAQESYEKLVILDPEYKGGWMNLGNVLLDQGSTSEALEKYRREEQLNPSADVYIQIGRAYADLKKYEQADQAYRQSIRLDSTQATAYMWLGQLYEAEGQWEQAVKFSERGLALSPTNVNYLYLTGAQLVKIEQYEHAIQYLKKVIRQRPWHAGAHYNLGQAFTRMGETRIGEQYLTAADSLRRIDRKVEDLVIFTEMHPEDIQNWINLGDTLRYYKRLEEALHAYESARLLEPYNLSVQTNIATLLFQLGSTDSAIQRYMALLQQDPTYTDVWLNLGVAFAQTGQMDDARWAWENLLKYDPQHQLARQYLSMLK